jgi:excisionase family DNA binding protein
MGRTGRRKRHVAQEASRNRFLTVAEVADELRVSTMTVYRLIKAQELPATRVGRSLRIRTDDVDRFLAGRYTEAG